MLQGWERRNIEIAVAQCFNKAVENLPKTANDESIREKTKHYYQLLEDLKREVMETIEYHKGRVSEVKQGLFEPNDHLETPEPNVDELGEGINDF